MSCPEEGWYISGGEAVLECGSGGELNGSIATCVEDGRFEPGITIYTTHVYNNTLCTIIIVYD